MRPLFSIHYALMFAVLGLAYLLSPSVPASAADKRPNVLFIYTDDQSQRTLSCYKNQGAWPWVKTPNIDRIAAEGVRFTSAYGAAWCTPSRACVLTGMLPYGIQGMNITAVIKGSYDPKVCRFWPAELRRAGYHTAQIGKWHIGDDSGHGRDWDHSVVWNQADIKGDWYNDQQLSIDGAAKQVVPGYSTDVYTRFAADYIQRKHDKPWLLWLCYNAPHSPNTVHPRHRELYTDAEVAIPADVFPPRPGKPRYLQTYGQWQKGADGKPLQGKQPLAEVVRSYNRLVAAVDDGVGQLLKALESTGQLDNTLIVFTSDQGFAWGEHGFRWKVGPYDACLKMPLLARLPGKVTKGVCPQPVSVVDLAPTFFALAGIELPWKMHGRDLTPLLKDPQAQWNAPLVMGHFQWQFGAQTDRGVTGKDALGGVPWWIFLRQGKYKYIRTLVADEIEELYDLEADSDELKNLALDPAKQELLAEHRERLLAELKRTDAKLVSNLPVPRTARPAK